MVEFKIKDAKTRHCPYCGILLDKIDSVIAATELGHISHNENEANYLKLNVHFDENVWDERRFMEFRCPECHEIITEDIDDAKAFIQLPEKYTC